jgi:hypothetical protein
LILTMFMFFLQVVALLVKGGNIFFSYRWSWCFLSCQAMVAKLFLSPTNFLSFSIVLARSQALSFLQNFILYYKLSLFQWSQ